MRTEIPVWLVLVVLGVLFIPALTLVGWDLCMPDIFHLPDITYWNAIGLDMLALPFVVPLVANVKVGEDAGS